MTQDDSYPKPGSLQWVWSWDLRDWSWGLWRPQGAMKSIYRWGYHIGPLEIRRWT